MRIGIIVIVTVALLSSYNLHAQKARAFPYEITFDSTQKPDEIVDSWGENSPKGADRYTVNGIVLSKGQSSSSGFVLDKIHFSSDFGLTVEFEYAMYDGALSNGNYGDGLAFFLYDGTKSPSIGSWGSGLGYVYRNTIPGNEWFALPGMDGGYLALGLDLYGDFKKRLTNPYESREGIQLPTSDFRNGGKDHLTLRGANADATLLKGYPVLYTTQLDNTPGNPNDVVSATLDYATGTYLTTTADVTIPIAIRPGRDANKKIKYNKVTIVLIPEDNDEEMYVSVKIKSNNTEVQLLDNFIYTNEFKTQDLSGNVYNFKTKIPDLFKLGFAAATGGSYQDQAIRNVRVSLPYSPNTEPDTAFLCLDNSNNVVVLHPFANDLFYKGTVMAPIAGNDASCIDYSSFQFEDKDGFALDPTDPYYYEDQNGIWEYSPTTQAVTFTLLNKKAQNVKHKIHYSARGISGVFSDEYYRSGTTLIEVTTDYCTLPVNKNIRASN